MCVKYGCDVSAGGCGDRLPGCDVSAGGCGDGLPVKVLGE